MTTDRHELTAMAVDPELSTPRREAARWALSEIAALQARAEKAEAALARAEADLLPVPGLCFGGSTDD